MTGKERREKILRLASINGNLSAIELAERFSVSRMTIHRDLKTLENLGRLKRIHGGAVPALQPQASEAQAACTSCNTPSLPHQRYLHCKTDQDKDCYCCACCGLKAQLQHNASGSFFASDMISGRTVAAIDAYFLIRSSATPCCNPSILSFADEAEASAFRSSFGGVLARLNETLEFLHTEESLEKAR